MTPVNDDNTPTPVHSAFAALQAVRSGYQPIPVRDRAKRPYNAAWTHQRYDAADEEFVVADFEQYAEQGASNVGLLLGEPSHGLIDVDIDHPKASRLKEHFLPATAMRTGRAGRPNSHYWYRTTGDTPGTRRYQMPDNSVSVELRSTGSQTVIPPSTHPSGEVYRWEGEEWADPTECDGRTLALQVALLGLGCVLIENWPAQGSRHDAYLALVGGLLRYGDDVHPWWERNLSPLIRALAIATGDEDGPDSREKESVRTTISKLRTGQRVTGFPRLAEIIGKDHAEKARRMAVEVESLSGFRRDTPQVVEVPEDADDPDQPSSLPPEERDPLGEREGTWQPVDLNPFLYGDIDPPKPTVLRREDGRGLMYPGRVNCLYGRSESAKSFIALMACAQEMAMGERTMYLDLEDEPANTLYRLQLLGVGKDDLRYQFTYIHPEEPLSMMQMDRWGHDTSNTKGRLNLELFLSALETVDPSLIVVDGMTVLYGLHGLDTNDATGTDIITNWLKTLVRRGRSTVVVIDHTGKGAPRGATPLGSQHKVAMVQGTALQVHPIEEPRKNRVGLIELLVGKDRPGEVRAFSSDAAIQVAAEVVMDSTIDGVVQYQIREPSPDETTVEGEKDDFEKVETRTLADTLRAHIPRVFDEALTESLTATEVRQRLESKFSIRSGYESWRLAMVSLIQVGVIDREGSRSNARYSLRAP